MTCPAGAVELPSGQVYVLGEVHDNPAHHAAQGALIEQIAPTAVVFEMLDPEQAARLGPDRPRDPQALDALLGWSEAGWPDIAIYMPVFDAIGVPVLGAAGEAGDLSAYGLDMPLPETEQATREALQADAHCGVLPAELLPQFVARQRAVDARLAARTLDALDRFGAPVVLIAGNGHARADWGVPAAIARVRPGIEVVAVVQGEEGSVPPGGDVVLDAPAPADRPDPCDAFR
ncbi:hypothetical protein DR046_11165 [Jannaschia formosa]|nr:hypothetical protein DR046_11165 [Jannaschia formosa]